MMNSNFKVTGRYMTGSEVTGYHLVDDNGNSLTVSRDKVIVMITRGLIENMRLQYDSNGGVLVRGKGVNILSLPVFDLKTSSFRETNAPKTGVTAKAVVNNPMAQYSVTKRIMYKTSCVGYIITDASGREAKVNREKTYEFALKGLLTNADAQKYIPKGTTTPKIVLRGVGCDLNSLPVIIVDQNGNSVDTTKTNQEITVRATQSRRAGIIYNDAKHQKATFNPGDYIVCTPTGGLNIMPISEARQKMTKSSNTTAICDTYLNGLADFSIEFLGDKRQKITPQMVLRWVIVRIGRQAATAA